MKESSWKKKSKHKTAVICGILMVNVLQLKKRLSKMYNNGSKLIYLQHLNKKYYTLCMLTASKKTLNAQNLNKSCKQ